VTGDAWRARLGTSDNNVMHAKPDLRVQIEV